MAEAWQQGHGLGGGGMDWGKLASFAGGPWGKALGLAGAGIGAAIGIAKAPDAMALSRKRMQFLLEQMRNIPGLAAQFRGQMIQGSGAEQANIIGGANAGVGAMRQNLIGRGLGNSALMQMLSGIGKSQLGMGMANMYGNYNRQAFGMANQNIMQGALGSLTEDDMRNRVIGGVVDAGGRLIDRTLYPRVA